MLGEAKAPCDQRSSPALGGPPHAGNQAVPGPESLAQGHKLPPTARAPGSLESLCTRLVPFLVLFLYPKSPPVTALPHPTSGLAVSEGPSVWVPLPRRPTVLLL